MLDWSDFSREENQEENNEVIKGWKKAAVMGHPEAKRRLFWLAYYHGIGFSVDDYNDALERGIYEIATGMNPMSLVYSKFTPFPLSDYSKSLTLEAIDNLKSWNEPSIQ